MNINTISLILTCMIPFFTHTAEPKKNTTPIEITDKKKSITSRCINNVKATGHFIGQESWEISKIMALAVGAGALYGILHDQVTARICLEYFSRGFHQANVTYWPSTGILGAAKGILQTTASPTVTACIWGPIATFEVGLYSGTLLAAVSRFGKRDKYTAKKLVKPVATVMAVTGICSALALNFPTNRNFIGSRSVTQGVSLENLDSFWRCASAHNTAYTVGAIATVGAALWVLYQRLKATDTEQKDKISQQLHDLEAKKTAQTTATPH